MSFYNGRFAVFSAAGLDDVGINGPLNQKIDLADFFGLFFKHLYKFRADGFALGFRIGNSFEF